MLTLRASQLDIFTRKMAGVIPVQKRKPVQKCQKWHYAKVDARKQLPLCRMRGALNIFGIICCGFQSSIICAWVILRILDILLVLRRSGLLFALAESPAHDVYSQSVLL